MAIAAIGLGGNIGAPRKRMAAALKLLDARDDVSVVRVSPLYRTPPWGKTDQAWFFNACALVETELDAQQLLDCCLETERQLGRVRGDRWGPRTIDLDVLLHGDVRSDTDQLTVPHPRMTERAFVMVPLSDIAPDAIVGLQSIDAWAQQAPSEGIEQLTPDGRWWRDETGAD
ncbi:2-amino-4-hydroxy-6-hydroxymethyldihydropteridine diphosphokinase [Pseudohoeflea coraliihabitans]|uniref:2-amino-4-hydroxy-6-hydroxymethyldihydropteridine pyrophosphokinase n=1 Tax=Pseudohoeflea coraliihabitans TaxID=2860393 RepID=A0ABS6WQ14_9HYPH|nr:2-amino-4-hydroxy-6-hydroxymethyldihydropteridine diphosphokinase [Pseudohoeflea sp. DP4N28-3]MBW3098064.1 2-amino-4-hydroxy-6-hydroxymethyldihydropteridine diphosphokinase [Pseudohoeflea sp. DP4N28-3]